MSSSTFSRNEHTIERVLRILVGLAVFATVFVGPKTPWGVLGLVPLITGAVGFCPLYALLGIRTCPVEEPKV